MIKRLIGGALVGLMLSGCSSGESRSDTTKAAISAIKSLAGGVTGAQSTAAEQPTWETSAELRAQLVSQNAVLLSVPAFGVSGPATPSAINNGKVTWVGDTVSVTTQGGGFLVATRGMPEDLFVSEVEGFGAAMRTNGSYSRIMEWPAEREEIRRVAFECAMSNAGIEAAEVAGRGVNATLYSDQCTGGGLQFTNKYWVDSRNKLVRTQQFVSRTTGYLITEVLF